MQDTCSAQNKHCAKRTCKCACNTSAQGNTTTQATQTTNCCKKCGKPYYCGNMSQGTNVNQCNVNAKKCCKSYYWDSMSQGTDVNQCNQNAKKCYKPSYAPSMMPGYSEMPPSCYPGMTPQRPQSDCVSRKPNPNACISTKEGNRQNMFIALSALLNAPAALGIANVTIMSDNTTIGGTGYQIISLTPELVTVSNGVNVESLSLCNVTNFTFTSTVPLIPQSPVNASCPCDVKNPYQAPINPNCPCSVPNPYQASLDYCGKNTPCLGYPGPVCPCSCGVTAAILENAQQFSVTLDENYPVDRLLAVCNGVIWFQYAPNSYAVFATCGDFSITYSLS